MRICLVYDCLFPHTVGGAERWYRSLSERLAAEGHDVTYLTLASGIVVLIPVFPASSVVAVGPRMALYTAEGPRRVAPPLVFGAGVLWHLLRHGRRYDVVHTCSFPYFSLLAAAAARRRGRYRLVVDWFEVWTRGYWREYLGRCQGDLGWRIQRLCARTTTARVLLLTPVRRAAASRGSARRDHDARRDLCGHRRPEVGSLNRPGRTAEPTRPGRCRARGRLRRPPHPGEAGAGDRAGDRLARAGACPGCVPRSSVTGPSGPRCCDWSTSSDSET